MSKKIVEISPYYHEPGVFSKLISFDNNEYCQTECFNCDYCVQYAYNNESKKCYLKTNLTISNGVPVKFYSNLTVKSIRSNFFINTNICKYDIENFWVKF